MSHIPRGSSRKHPHEDAVREGAARGSIECKRVIESWEMGTQYKPPTSVDEHHHPYYAAIADGATSGSELCTSHMREWGMPRTSGRKFPHEDAIREAAGMGSTEAKKVVKHWEKGVDYTPPGEEQGRRFFYAVSEGARLGSSLCKGVMTNSWNIRM